MNSTSPPLSVQATPVATPGPRRPELHVAPEPRRPEVRLQVAVVDGGHDLVRRERRGVDAAGRHPRRDLARDGAELALEVAHAGLARVLADQAPQRARR